MDHPVDDRCGHLVVSEHGPPSRELEVGGEDDRLRLAGLRHHLEEQPRALGVEGQGPSSSTTGRSARPIWASSRSSLPSPFARRRRTARDGAVKNLVSILASQHIMHRAEAMWVFPVPTSPIRTRSPLPRMNDSDSRSSRPNPCGHETIPQSYPSKVLGAGSAQRRSREARSEASRLAASALR